MKEQIRKSWLFMSTTQKPSYLETDQHPKQTYVTQRQYDNFEINQALFDYGEPTLGSKMYVIGRGKKSFCKRPRLALSVLS